MTKQQFRQWVSGGIRILDGATGTELQKLGMPIGVCPEKWVIENPEALIKIQQAYVEAGSDIIYTCTFGGNGLKLKEYGIEDVVHFNREIARISKQAAAGKALVAGDIAPTGQMMEPFGSYTFEQIVNVYKEQVQGLLQGGVDLFVIETMMDIQEARAALLAVKESCELPVIVTMTFDKSGHTLSGTDPLTALVTLQSLGADAVGCNCSTGPEEMLKIIRELKPHARVPLVAKPNAGLPRLVDGKTIFDMNADAFGDHIQSLADTGVHLLGGCCGTSPEFIRKIASAAKGKQGKSIETSDQTLMITSSRKAIAIDHHLPDGLIGECIDPGVDQKLQEDLLAGSTDLVVEYAMDQLDEGVQVICVRAEMPGLDEVKTLTDIVSALSTQVQAPLCLISSSPKALESALRIYPGRVLLNLGSVEEAKMKEILPVAEKYGTAVIFPPEDDRRADQG